MPALHIITLHITCLIFFALQTHRIWYVCMCGYVCMYIYVWVCVFVPAAFVLSKAGMSIQFEINCNTQRKLSSLQGRSYLAPLSLLYLNETISPPPGPATLLKHITKTQGTCPLATEIQG